MVYNSPIKEKNREEKNREEKNRIEMLEVLLKYT